MKKTLLVTNDFPPRAGGIETYLEGFARTLNPEQLVIYTSSRAAGIKEYDASTPWTMYRDPTSILLPTPRTRKRMEALIRRHAIENVWFGASVPLGIMAKAAREAGAKRTIATSHGHEIGWSMIPGARTFLSRVFASQDVVTYLTDATLKRLRPYIPDSTSLVRLPGGINTDAFIFNAVDRARLRKRYGIDENARVVVCISRLVPRKGQDMLIKAWKTLAHKHPGVQLVIVGEGSYEKHLRTLVEESPVSHLITLTGGVPYDELPAHYSMGDIFAMPCRTRGSGLDIEGLGIVYLEAASTGLPVLAGNSGGAPEAIIDNETGYVADGHSLESIIEKLDMLLSDPDKATAMGRRGLEWVRGEWTWAKLAEPLLDVLS